MKVVDHSIRILYPTNKAEWIKEAKFVEYAARNCYQSKDKISEDSWIDMARQLRKNNHGAMLEFGNIIISIITDKVIQTEIVRHRLVSYGIESTRFINYSKDKFDNEITVVRPTNFLIGEAAYDIWYKLCLNAEETYLKQISNNIKPQFAAKVLPYSMKGEIIMKSNWRELLHIINLRTAPDAHPDIQKIFTDIKNECNKYMPYIFGEST